MYLLYVFETDTSGILLANTLKFKHGSVPPQEEPYVLLRWGSSKYADLDKPKIQIINPAKGIEKAASKLDALILLKQYGVRVPTFSPSYKELWEMNREKIVGQTVFRSGGRGFKFYDNIPPEEMKEERQYYLEYIDGDEYRILRAFNKFLIYRRTPLRANPNPHCRSTSNGWFLRRISQGNRRRDIWKQAIKACDALGLQIGGVDIRVRDDEAYVLEVNTGPRLNPYRAKFLKQQIMRNI